MKILLKLLLLLVMMGYLVLAITRIARGGDTTVCTGVNVIIADSVHAGFITEAEVRRMLAADSLSPEGKRMEDINGEAIEAALLRNSFVREARCYKTPGGIVNLHIGQRLPILRVKADNGEDYYIDAAGVKMQVQNYTADLVVATGDLQQAIVRRQLLHLARYIHHHRFANDLITQIYVERNGRMTLVPRMGCDLITLGRVDSLAIPGQMEKLRALYTQVLPTVGWSAYREINLEYANQIVCKKA